MRHGCPFSSQQPIAPRGPAGPTFWDAWPWHCGQSCDWACWPEAISTSMTMAPSRRRLVFRMGWFLRRVNDACPWTAASPTAGMKTLLVVADREKVKERVWRGWERSGWNGEISSTPGPSRASTRTVHRATRPRETNAGDGRPMRGGRQDAERRGKARWEPSGFEGLAMISACAACSGEVLSDDFTARDAEDGVRRLGK